MSNHYDRAPGALLVEALRLNAVKSLDYDSDTVPGIIAHEARHYVSMGCFTDDRSSSEGVLWQVAGLFQVVPLAEFVGPTMTYAEHHADEAQAEFGNLWGVRVISLEDQSVWVFNGGYWSICADSQDVRRVVLDDKAARAALAGAAAWLPNYLQDYITLYDLCRYKFKTVKAFAEAWGVSAGTASMILQGRHIMTMAHDEVLRLAALFGVDYQRVTDAQSASYQQFMATWSRSFAPAAVRDGVRR